MASSDDKPSCSSPWDDPASRLDDVDVSGVCTEAETEDVEFAIADGRSSKSTPKSEEGVEGSNPSITDPVPEADRNELLSEVSVDKNLSTTENESSTEVPTNPVKQIIALAVHSAMSSPSQEVEKAVRVASTSDDPMNTSTSTSSDTAIRPSVIPLMRPIGFFSPYIEDQIVVARAGPDVFAKNIKNAVESKRVNDDETKDASQTDDVKSGIIEEKESGKVETVVTTTPNNETVAESSTPIQDASQSELESENDVQLIDFGDGPLAEPLTEPLAEPLAELLTEPTVEPQIKPQIEPQTETNDKGNTHDPATLAAAKAWHDSIIRRVSRLKGLSKWLGERNKRMDGMVEILVRSLEHMGVGAVTDHVGNLIPLQNFRLNSAIKLSQPDNTWMTHDDDMLSNDINAWIPHFTPDDDNEPLTLEQMRKYESQVDVLRGENEALQRSLQTAFDNQVTLGSHVGQWKACIDSAGQQLCRLNQDVHEAKSRERHLRHLLGEERRTKDCLLQRNVARKTEMRAPAKDSIWHQNDMAYQQQHPQQIGGNNQSSWNQRRQVDSASASSNVTYAYPSPVSSPRPRFTFAAPEQVASSSTRLPDDRYHRWGATRQRARSNGLNSAAPPFKPSRRVQYDKRRHDQPSVREAMWTRGTWPGKQPNHDYNGNEVVYDPSIKAFFDNYVRVHTERLRQQEQGRGAVGAPSDTASTAQAQSLQPASPVFMQQQQQQQMPDQPVVYYTPPEQDQQPLIDLQQEIQPVPSNTVLPAEQGLVQPQIQPLIQAQAQPVIQAQIQPVIHPQVQFAQVEEQVY